MTFLNLYLNKISAPGLFFYFFSFGILTLDAKHGNQKSKNKKKLKVACGRCLFELMQIVNHRAVGWLDLILLQSFFGFVRSAFVPTKVFKLRNPKNDFEEV